MLTGGKQHFKAYLCVLNRFRGFARLYFQRLTLKRDKSKMAAVEILQKMDSETDFSSNSDYHEFVNEILFVSNILQPFQFEPVFTAVEIQATRT